MYLFSHSWSEEEGSMFDPDNPKAETFLSEWDSWFLSNPSYEYRRHVFSDSSPMHRRFARKPRQDWKIMDHLRETFSPIWS